MVVSVWAWSLFVWSSAYSGEKTGYRLLWSATLLYNWPYQPGFAAHHDTRSLNHLRTGQRCVMQICTDRALPVAWSAIRKCGQQQTLRHTVDTCPLAKKNHCWQRRIQLAGNAGDCSAREMKITRLRRIAPDKPVSLLAAERDSRNRCLHNERRRAWSYDPVLPGLPTKYISTQWTIKNVTFYFFTITLANLNNRFL